MTKYCEYNYFTLYFPYVAKFDVAKFDVTSDTDWGHEINDAYTNIIVLARQ